MEDFAEIAGIEIIRIDADTSLTLLRQELQWNDGTSSWQ
jgi:L-arabinose isomerase